MPLTGYTQTKGHSLKISLSNKGRIVTKKTREKIGNALRGKLQSEELKIRLGNIRRGSKRPDSTKLKMSIAIRGENHPSWGGGTIKYKRIIVLQRDNYTCTQCSYSEKEIMQVDHIIPRCKGGSDEIDNLRCLCPNCHARKSRTEKNTKKIMSF